MTILGSLDQFDEVIAEAKALLTTEHEDIAPITATHGHVCSALLYWKAGWISDEQLHLWALMIQLHHAAVVTDAAADHAAVQDWLIAQAEHLKTLTAQRKRIHPVGAKGPPLTLTGLRSPAFSATKHTDSDPRKDTV